jgi:hypothetical protein
MVANRHLSDVGGVQDREHGKLPKGWQGGRSRQGLMVQYAWIGSGGGAVVLGGGKAHHRGKGARELTFSSTH